MTYRLLTRFLTAACILLYAVGAQAGKSVYTEKFQDKNGVFFTSKEFKGVKADGKTDVSDVLQEAINRVKTERNFGILYIPEGKYLITKTIYVPAAIRLIGYGKTRPVFILGKNTPGYQDQPNWMFWFTSGIVNRGGQPSDANAGTFYSGFSNIDILIEEGNPGAVGLRTHYAQHGVLSHCTINAGSGYAGLTDVGNEMEDVEFIGGKYGIATGRPSPSWPMLIADCSFKGQTEAAISSRDAALTILSSSFADAPYGIVCENESEHLYVEDCSFDNISEVAILHNREILSTNQINVRNASFRNVIIPISRTTGHGSERSVSKSFSGIYKLDIHFGFSSGSMGQGVSHSSGQSSGTLTEFKVAGNSIPSLPDMSQWVSVTDFGAVGDGVADDTEALRKAIESSDNLYFPEGWYRVSETVKMKPQTKMIGLHPYSTQIILENGTSAFSGFGGPVAVVESSEGGNNILTGIGISTGTLNYRAVACKWMAGAESYLNDVKFVGGHGTMQKPVQTQSQTAIPSFGGYSQQGWDTQYWSLWITNGGGGTFKDIWTANTCAASGLYVSDTQTPSRIMAISLEHHQREESRFDNVRNFSIYAMQYEEESAEGKDCISMTMNNCRDMLFANTWMYRVIRVNTPRDYGILITGCRNIDFYNMHCWTQVLPMTAATIFDPNRKLSVWPGDFAHQHITGDERSRMPVGDAIMIGTGYEFATGLTRDSKGNVYFCENRLKKIYKWDASTGLISMIADFPWKPFSLAVDTKDNLIVICRYDPQPGLGEHIERLPDDNPNYSGWGNGGWEARAYTITSHDVMQPLPLVQTSSVKAERVIHPSHRWRPDFIEVATSMPEQSFLAADGVTIIPRTYDLGRSVQLTAVNPSDDKAAYIINEENKSTYKFKVLPDGRLAEPENVLPHGDYGVCTTPDGTIFCVAEGRLNINNNKTGEYTQYELDERPHSVVFGGTENEYLFATTNTGLYRIRYR